MEKEQKKLSTGVVVLIITLVVALVTVSTILAYKMLNEEETNKPLTEVNNEQKEVEENKTEDKEEVKEENTKKEEKNEEKKQDEVEDFEDEDTNVTGNLKSFDSFELNGKKVKLELEAEVEKDGEDEQYGYTEEYIIKINGKEVKGIEKQDNQYYSLLSNSYELSYFPDQENGKDYIALSIYGGGDSYSTAEVYIIDEKANLIAKVEKAHPGTGFYFKDERMHEDYLEWEVVSHEGYIIDFDIGDTEEERVEKHKYTIENGKLKDVIVETYSEDEVGGAGKKAW